MAYNSLRDFIQKLEKDGDLIRVSEPVSNHLEITEIQTRIIKNQAPAVIFENVISKDGKKYDIPVVSNLFSTIDRIKTGLNTDNLRELGEMLAFLRQPTPPNSIKEAFDMLPKFRNTLSMKPKIVSKAPVQEVLLTGDEVDLTKFPIQYCWDGEPAPLITWGLVVTKPYGEGNYNIAVYRMQVVNKNTVIMRWLQHRGGARHFLEWKRAGEKKMPIAVAIGADPATMIAAVTPVPETISEYEYSGLLRGQKLELVNCKTVPMKVPANAEIVLEGYVSTEETMKEGPYGDHTGYYNSVEEFPVFNISAITHRKNPLYMTTHMGRPIDEPSVLGMALNEMFVPLIKQQFPEIVDFWLPPEACSYRIAVVSIKKDFPAHAKRIMMGVWSYLRQFMYTKFVIIVDDDIDVRNWSDVIWAVSTRVDPARDMLIVENTPIDYLDFASPKSGLGSKVGIDATNKSYPEVERTWGTPIKMREDIVAMVNEKWDKFGID